MTDLPHITIRSATENDAPALLGIYTHYVANTAISFETDVPSLEEFQKTDCKYNDNVSVPCRRI